MHPNKIKSAIYRALENFNCSVSYTKSYSGKCAYFTVEIHDDWDWDLIDGALEQVCDEYDLWIDVDSDGDFDLCINND